MKSAERHLRLKEIFARDEFVDSEALGRRLGVSESTIRRDLIELERRGVLRRVHGGALSLQTTDEMLDMGRLSNISHPEKERIGRVAAALVQDGQTLLLGAGSTVVEVARHLGGRALQVVTNSIPVAQVFWDCKTVEVTMTGGYVFPRTGMQIGPICDQMLERISADVLIMGIAGITAEGLSDSNSLIMGTMLKLMERSARVIVVADHTKFGRRSLVHVAPLSRVDLIVTDSAVGAHHREMLREHGVRFELA
jgi:DeoR/GlpR family transcriptional regulator of sugar metabolism